MRKISLIFAILILELFAFQNAHTEEHKCINKRTMYEDYSMRRFVLWRVHTQESPDFKIRVDIVLDSVLRGEENFYADRKWYISTRTRCEGKFPCEIRNNLKLNTYYLVLADALRFVQNNKERCELLFYDEDYALPDTPENREMLSKIWDDTKVVYERQPDSRFGYDSRKEKSGSVK